MRIVVDTNITLRSLLLQSSSLKWIFDAFRQNKIQLVFSPFLIQELIRVLTYPRITRKYKLNPDDIKKLINSIYYFGIIVHPQEKLNICRDEKDNMLLETALAGEAEYIITSDKDLLVIKEFRGIKIITPAHFKKRLLFSS